MRAARSILPSPCSPVLSAHVSSCLSFHLLFPWFPPLAAAAGAAGAVPRSIVLCHSLLYKC